MKWLSRIFIFVKFQIQIQILFQAGLQQRMTEQENNLLQMKAELLRLGFTKESLEAEKVGPHFHMPTFHF